MSRVELAATIDGRSCQLWERFGKELKILKCQLSRTESTGPMFDYVLIIRRSLV
jgi:hypothetical protein